ncbi:hypothetical protein ACF3NA_02145 [Alkanindiges sp. WGS2144]|uniref:hypothetical protein n=1 Tax=Alkanindiges sp. WGS2144 TaxID=3366808 RepID=UPI0037511138
MNSQVNAVKKRKLLSALVSDMAQTFRDHPSLSSLQPVKELLEKQVPFNQLASLPKNQALDLLDQFQARVTPQFYTGLCAQSPWFGSTEKRLTGLGSASLFVPVTADGLAQKHPPFTVQQQWGRVGRQAELFKEQLQRKIDRMTGVRAKIDEWDTVFPEDE